MTFPPTSGSFDYDRWHLRQPGDDSNSAQFASVHESHHKQFQDSTRLGAVARIYHSLWTATGVPSNRDTAGALTQASSHPVRSAAQQSAEVVGTSPRRCSPYPVG